MKWNIVVGSLVLGASLCTPSFAGFGLLDRMLGLKGSGCDSTCCDTGCGAGPSCGVESACGNGCGAGPSCGVESACGNGCGAGPTCGVESACGNGCGAAPSCGCETSCAPSCNTGCGHRRPLHELFCAARHKKNHLLHHLRGNSCDSCCAPACEPSCAAAPSCGCESACGNGCGAAPSCGCEVASPCCDTGCGGHRHHGLLHRLFKHKRGNGCCDMGCDSCGVAASSCNGGCGGGVAAPAAHGDAAPMPPAPIVDPSAYLQSNRRVIQATSYVR